MFDIDAARAGVVSRHYGLPAYPSLEALLADPAVDAVVNLTSIRSHYAVSRRRHGIGWRAALRAWERIRWTASASASCWAVRRSACSRTATAGRSPASCSPSRSSPVVLAAGGFGWLKTPPWKART